MLQGFLFGLGFMLAILIIFGLVGIGGYLLLKWEQGKLKI